MNIDLTDYIPNKNGFTIEKKILDYETIYIVRISQRKGAENARIDYTKLKENNIQNNKIIWDKDHLNKMKTGDWLGFIVGENYNESIELYYIVDEESIDNRSISWCQNTPYTKNNGESSVKEREVVVLLNQSPIIYDWNTWKLMCGYKDKYMPRGTIKCKNPFKIDSK